MKFSNALPVLAAAVFLTACNFTLAEDIPPPPGMFAPTPMPTLGPLYPSSPPDVKNGAAIFASAACRCHGATGLGMDRRAWPAPRHGSRARACRKWPADAVPAACYRPSPRATWIVFMPHSGAR